MGGYIHTQEHWPQFSWNRESLSGRLASVRHEQGRLLGRMEALGFKLRQEAVLRTLTEDVLKQRNRGRKVGRRAGPILDRAPPRHGHWGP